MNKRRSELYQKTLRIGVRFNGTSFELLDGKPLPKLHPGFAELVVSPEMIENRDERAALMREIRLPFLPKDAVVMIGVSSNVLGRSDGLIDPEVLKLPCEYLLAAVRLDEDLFLKIRGDDQARLASCHCWILPLRRNATSLNHAFTLISEHYETQRLTHTANVFQRAWVEINKRWHALDDLRLATIAGAAPQQSSEAASSSS